MQFQNSNFDHCHALSAIPLRKLLSYRNLVFVKKVRVAPGICAPLWELPLHWLSCVSLFFSLSWRQRQNRPLLKSELMLIKASRSDEMPLNIREIELRCAFKLIIYSQLRIGFYSHTYIRIFLVNLCLLIAPQTSSKRGDELLVLGKMREPNL